MNVCICEDDNKFLKIDENILRKTDYNLKSILFKFENEKRIIIITEEENSLIPVFVFNKKTFFFKQIKFLKNNLEFDFKMFSSLMQLNETLKEINIDKNERRQNKENKIWLYEKNFNLLKVNFFYKIKNEKTFLYLEIKRKDKFYNYRIILKEKSLNKIHNMIMNNSRIFYTGYDHIYGFSITDNDGIYKTLIFDIKNISYRNFEIKSSKSKTEINDFIINNLTKNKKTFLKNKMIFEVL